MDRDSRVDGIWLAKAAGEELTQLGAVVETLESSMGRWIDAAGAGANAIQELQSIDLIGQTLRELAGVFERYRASAIAGCEDAVDASLEGVRLGALRARLIAMRDGVPPPLAASTEVELF